MMTLSFMLSSRWSRSKSSRSAQAESPYASYRSSSCRIMSLKKTESLASSNLIGQSFGETVRTQEVLALRVQKS